MAKESEVNVSLFDGEYSVTKCNHSKLGEGFEIDFTQMYESPVELSYANMQVISDYFGTKDIDFDNVSEGGCETCDYGSRYGYTIQVYGATKNHPFMVAG